MIGGMAHRFGVLYLALFERISANSWRPMPRPPEGTAVTRGPGHDPDRVLLAGRVVQASGTAVMMPLLMTTVMNLVPARSRETVMGNISMLSASIY